MNSWNRSAQQIIQLKSSCRLAAPRLLSADRPKRVTIMKGDDVQRLIRQGQDKAQETRKPILLRLTGAPGRPQERFILPPKPTVPARSSDQQIPSEPDKKSSAVKLGLNDNYTTKSLEAKVKKLSNLNDKLRDNLEKQRERVAVAESKLVWLKEEFEQHKENQEALCNENTQLREKIRIDQDRILKAKARINELEQISRLPQATLDEDTEGQLERQAGAIKRYKTEIIDLKISNEALKKQVAILLGQLDNPE